MEEGTLNSGQANTRNLKSRGPFDIDAEILKCEKALLDLGLSQKQVDDLAAAIDSINSSILDTYFKEFYD